MPADSLATGVDRVRGVTPPRLKQLQRLGIRTIGDLLFHFPRTYEDLTNVRPLRTLAEGEFQTVQGEVVEIAGDRLADGRSVVRVVVSDDGKNCVEGIWFNQSYAARRFRYGMRVAFSGKPKWFRDHWQINNPRVQVLDGAQGAGSEEKAGAPPQPLGIVPVYPLTEELRNDQLWALIRRAVQSHARFLQEILPDELRHPHGLPDIQQAIRDVHMPATLDAAQAGRRRFVYEEFLILQLALALRRRDLRDRQQAPKLPVTPTIDARIRRLFPFQLTRDQDQAIAEVCRDLASDRPMQRLLQADVGAGKTAVAVYALLVAVANKYQAALMAPTEVLARQHYHTLERYLAHSRVRRLLLTGALTPKERKAALRSIEAGDVDLVVGTQALVQEDVRFTRLGLVVIDEQHRFGVNQRAGIRKLGVDPHYLVMTATPIPRTLALTVFGDLDVSTIRQLPPGRQPVVTRVVPAAQRERIFAKIADELRQGRQGFVICPLVTEQENKDLKAATQTHAELQAGPFREFRLGLLHGKKDEADKDRVMEAFRRRELDLLVCTSVVEVGVDVPNATVMVIEHADRFGISQLHQLRGRVTRGKVAGQCYLFTNSSTEEAKERIRAVVRTRDGFALAELDARQRGGGEFFGTRQHGVGAFRFGDVLIDGETLRAARRDAFALVARDAGLREPGHQSLRRTVLERYGTGLELSEIG
jgi:ATP-dependent DNA helicase RecG